MQGRVLCSAPGEYGGIRTDLQMRVPSQDGVWAARDCVETIDLIAARKAADAVRRREPGGVSGSGASLGA